MIIDKNTLRAITKEINPQQAEYVRGIGEIIQDVRENAPEYEFDGKMDDIIYLAKIMAFADKFRNLHWAAMNLSYHKTLDEFCEELEEYKDEIAENIQAIVGQLNGSEITKLELPVSNNPLDVINELKQCVQNWFALHADEIAYEGCRNATSGMLQTIHKYIYLFRLCKIDSKK